MLARDRNERVPPSPTVFRKSAQLSLATSCYIQLCHTMSYICHTMSSMSSFAFLSFSRNHSSHAKTILCFFICRCSLCSLLSSIFGERRGGFCYAMLNSFCSFGSFEVDASQCRQSKRSRLANPEIRCFAWCCEFHLAFQHIPAYS